MFFKACTILLYPQNHLFGMASVMVDSLPNLALTAPGPLEMATSGFISPTGDGNLSLEQAGAYWLAIGNCEKILPAAVVNDFVAARIEHIEENEGRKPGGRERKRIKDDILYELLPRAFVKTSRIDAFLDDKAGALFVNAATARKADQATSAIRDLLGTFPALPINAENAPRRVMTGWLAGGAMPDGLTLGESCELREPIDGGGVLRARNQELSSEEIQHHLEAGKQVAAIELCWQDHITFTLTDGLQLRGIKWLDGAMDPLDEIDGEGKQAEMKARFALQLGELRGLLIMLREAFSLSEVV